MGDLGAGLDQVLLTKKGLLAAGLGRGVLLYLAKVGMAKS